MMLALADRQFAGASIFSRIVERGGVDAPSTRSSNQPSEVTDMREYKLKPCQWCGQDFQPEGSRQVWCSLGCRLEENHIVCPSGCWISTDCVETSGYGHFRWHGEDLKTHRAAWEAWRGPIPEGMQVLHTCDVRNCINPAHLWLGTNADNVADKVSKDRQYRGERHSDAKLTEDDVRSIRSLCESGMMQKTVAGIFGIDRSQVTRIMSGKAWKHVR